MAGWQYCAACGTRIAINRKEDNDDVAARPARPLGIVQTSAEKVRMKEFMMSMFFFFKKVSPVPKVSISTTYYRGQYPIPSITPVTIFPPDNECVHTIPAQFENGDKCERPPFHTNKRHILKALDFKNGPLNWHSLKTASRVFSLQNDEHEHFDAFKARPIY